MIVLVKIFPWSKDELFLTSDSTIKKGERVIIETPFGLEAGEVVNIVSEQISPEKETRESKIDKDIKPILRRANFSEFEAINRYSQRRKEALKICRGEIKKANLAMKLVDVQFSVDGSHVTFAFVAEKRLDFRALVKALTRQFQKSVRLEQIGSRDEIRNWSGYGPCGREICCVKFLSHLESISSEVLRVQGLGHLGSAKVTGPCGRLKCCLGFEKSFYEELVKNLPPLDSLVETKQGRGKVVSWHNILKGEIKVEIEDGPAEATKEKEKIIVLAREIKRL